MTLSQDDSALHLQLQAVVGEKTMFGFCNWVLHTSLGPQCDPGRDSGVDIRRRRDGECDPVQGDPDGALSLPSIHRDASEPGSGRKWPINRQVNTSTILIFLYQR